MKQYAEHWEKVYFFKEYGDFDNFFIKLGYVCEEGEFVSSRGAPLTNKVAANGELIFKNVNIDFSKYKLLAEEIGEPQNGILTVKEVYGYAPENSYETYGAEPVNQFGLKDPSGYLKGEILMNLTENRYDPLEDVFYLKMASVDGFEVGNLVKPTCDYRALVINSGTVGTMHLPRGESAEVPILAIDAANKILKTRAYGMQFYHPNGASVGQADEASVMNGIYRNNGHANPDVYGSGWRPSWLTRQSFNRTPSTEIMSVVSVITFHTSIPSLDKRFKVMSGDGEVDTIENGVSNPDADTWRQWMDAGRRWNIQDAVIEVVYPNALYKKILKQTPAS